MTLRKLSWMAGERMRVTGLAAAWAASAIIAFIPLTGQKLDPNEINPFKGERPDDPGVARIKAFIAKRRWAALGKLARGPQE